MAKVNAEDPLIVARIIATDKRMIAAYPVVKLSGLRVQLCPTPAALGKTIQLLPEEQVS